MLPGYEDIVRRLGEPLWWDDHGVPRYDPFAPNMGDVYADGAALLLIACQYCGKTMRVGVFVNSASAHRALYEQERFGHISWPDPKAGETGDFGYGDPPRHECAGDTMSCRILEVLECWAKPGWEWKRKPECEGEVVGE